MNAQRGRDKTSGRPLDSGIINDGRERAVEGILKVLLPEIRNAVQAQYAADLSNARPLRRVWILLQMKREIKRRVAEQIKQKAPPDGLYSLSGSR